MFSPNEIAIDAFVTHTLTGFTDLFADADAAQTQALELAARTALETLLNCDCPYHDMHHTILVADVGQTILRGRQMATNDLSTHDWLQAVVAMLFHDIGYLRQLLDADTAERSLIDSEGGCIAPPAGASDAFMTPYHVTRGAIFVASRFVDEPCIDTEVVADCIEMTRFPVPAEARYQATDTLPGLVRAADLIGQMADPGYRQKLSRLYAEFVETGEAARLGYYSTGDLRDGFPEFFYAQVQPYIGPAVGYLKRTAEGQQWIENLYRRLDECGSDPAQDPKTRAPELIVNLPETTAH